MNPDQQAQFDDMMKRLSSLENFVSSKKTQQISYPLDDVSRKIIGELIPAATVIDATTLVNTGDYIWTTLGGTAGRLICDGSSLLRTDYAALFAAIGTTYGSADGTHFNVPNLIGRVMVMVGDATFTAMGQTGGEVNHTLDASEIPSHTHSMGSFFSGNGSSNGVSGGGIAPNVNTQTGATGGGGGHNNLQPYLVARCYIKT